MRTSGCKVPAAGPRAGVRGTAAVIDGIGVRLELCQPQCLSFAWNGGIPGGMQGDSLDKQSDGSSCS